MNFDSDDAARLVDILRSAAATEILPRFRKLGAADVDTKSAHDDLVTLADTEAERAITAALHAIYPDALVIGEEAVAAEPALRAQLSQAELAFVIDPVDGTWNFAQGLATFGTILVATQLARPIFGALFDPSFDDAIVATANDHARYVHADGTSTNIELSPDSTPGLTGFVPLNSLPDSKLAAMGAVHSSFNRIMSLRCSCHEFRLMAQGSVDFMLSARLTPWDHAAGSLITEKAGGVSRMLDGSAYCTDKRSGYLLSARCENVWSDVADRLAFLLD